MALALAIPEAPAWPVAGSHRLGCGIGVVARNLNQPCHPPEWFRGCAGFNLRAKAPRRLPVTNGTLSSAIRCGGRP